MRLIDADDLLKYVEISKNNKHHKDSITQSCHMHEHNHFISMIMLQETIEPRKKGKWIIDGHHIGCNQCGTYMCDKDREGDKFPINYCPNCGSDMRGEYEDH